MTDYPDDEEYLKPNEFDLDATWELYSDPTVAQIAEDQGWNDWREIIGVVGTFDPLDIRPGEYYSIDDAIKEAWAVGIITWSTFVFDYATGAWHIVVDYIEPEPEEP